jgi:aerobic carbon-monoxide dehydrogenase medium subunit
MYAFNYHKAKSVAEAAGLLAGNEGAKLMSGGMTLIPTLKQRLAQPSDLVDIGQLSELRGIERKGERLVIGAAMRHVEVAGSEVVRSAIPALAALAAGIGDPQVRNRGTMGGSVANNDPAADYPAAVLGLDARIVTNRRTHPADGFFLGVFATALEEGEIITRIEFALPRRAAYAKFRHPASGYAMTGVLVADMGKAVRVAVTGAGPGVFRWAEAEAALAADFSAAAIAGLDVDPAGLNADFHAPAEYRANLVKVMARRALESLQ